MNDTIIFMKTMKREIKFRGKDIETGKWVYGFYVRLEDTFRKPIEGKERITNRIYTGSADSCVAPTGYDFSGDWYEVGPKTIGQFTGMHDKEGREIYEGDIVHVEFDSPWGVQKYDGEIIFNKHSFDLKIHKVDGEKEHEEVGGFLILNGDDNEFSIIGNVYDNSED